MGINKEILKRAKKIKMIMLDVDGVLLLSRHDGFAYVLGPLGRVLRRTVHADTGVVVPGRPYEQPAHPGPRLERTRGPCLRVTEEGRTPLADDFDAEGLADFIQHLVAEAQLATRLSERGVEVERLPELAASAAKQWTGDFNPRGVDEAQLLELYQRAF